VHFFDLWTNAFIGELAHVITEQKFIFRERNQRLGRGNLWSCYLGHAEILKKTEFNKLKIVTLVSATPLSTKQRRQLSNGLKFCSSIGFIRLISRQRFWL